MAKKYLLGLFFILCSFKLSLQTICDDGSECAGESTCCPSHGGFFCCPLKNAVCCSDGNHCCPTGYKCNIEERKCEQKDIYGTSLNKTDFYELTPTSLIYRKGWNELFYNCKDDLSNLKHDLISIFTKFLEGTHNPQAYIESKENFYKLLNDGKITSKDCIKFLKEVFG